MGEALEHLRKTLEDYRQQLAVKRNEAARILAFVNDLEERLGLTKTSFSNTGGISWAVSLGEENRATDTSLSPRPSIASIRPDEYLGDPPLDAAKKYLRRIRQAAPLDEIAEAISRGGAAIKGADWKAELDASLLRSTREVVKVHDGTYGLVEFYSEEQLKRLRSVRRQRQPNTTQRGGRPRKRGRPRRRGRRKAAEGSGNPEPSA